MTTTLTLHGLLEQLKQVNLEIEKCILNGDGDDECYTDDEEEYPGDARFTQ